MRKSSQLISTPVGHVAIDGTRVSVDQVIPRWIAEGDAAITRVAEYWPETFVASLRKILAELRSSWPIAPVLPAAPSVTQDCFRPNAIIRNLVRGYWADDTWRQETQAEVELSNPRVVQQGQCAMADEIIVHTREARGTAKPEAIAITPAVNPALVSEFFARTKISGIRSLDKTFRNADGYLLYVNPKSIEDPGQHAAVSMLVSIRSHEKTFYDAVATAWASPGRNVVFRTSHLPGRLFDSLDSLASMEWSETSVAAAMKRWEDYCKALTNAFGREQLAWIVENVDRLTVMTDLPIE